MPVWFLHNYSFVIAPPWDLVVFQADLHASVLMPCILGHYAPLRRATKAKACLKNNKSHKEGVTIWLYMQEPDRQIPFQKMYMQNQF